MHPGCIPTITRVFCYATSNSRSNVSMILYAGAFENVKNVVDILANQNYVKNLIRVSVVWNFRNNIFPSYL